MSGELHEISAEIGELRAEMRRANEDRRAMAATLVRIEESVGRLAGRVRERRAWLAGAGAVISLVAGAAGALLTAKLKVWFS